MTNEEMQIELAKATGIEVGDTVKIKYESNQEFLDSVGMGVLMGCDSDLHGGQPNIIGETHMVKGIYCGHSFEFDIDEYEDACFPWFAVELVRKSTEILIDGSPVKFFDNHIESMGQTVSKETVNKIYEGLHA